MKPSNAAMRDADPKNWLSNPHHKSADGQRNCHMSVALQLFSIRIFFSLSFSIMFYIHTLHYITLHYIALHGITLHYIHYIHTYVYIYIYICYLSIYLQCIIRSSKKRVSLKQMSKMPCLPSWVVHEGNEVRQQEAVSTFSAEAIR